MQHNHVIEKDGFKPSSSRGGSKKGKKVLSWTTGDLALYKIAMQRIMESCEPGLVMTRNFNGQYGPVALLDHMEKYHPELYLQLRTSRMPMYPERTRAEMLGVIYDRGHKGFYWNYGEPHSIERAIYSPEHYSKSSSLRSRVPEAEAKFRTILKLSKPK